MFPQCCAYKGVSSCFVYIKFRLSPGWTLSWFLPLTVSTMFTVRCCLVILLAGVPTIKPTVDHDLVKKYFVDIYNEALLRAMRAQGDVKRRADDETPRNSIIDKQYSPYSAWKGEPPTHKHKHHSHFHKHR